MAGCTNLVAVPPATKDDGVFALWNMDIFRFVNLVLPFLRFYVVKTQPYDYLALGLPGIGGLGILNEKGVASVYNAVGLKDGGNSGENVLQFNNKIMRTCANVDEVIDTFEKTERYTVPGQAISIFLNLNSMWCDSTGDAATIEYSYRHFIAKKVDSTGIMASTNHHQYLDPQLTGCSTPSTQHAIAGSYARLGRAWELALKIAENEKFDLDMMKRFASDHGINYDLLRETHFDLPDPESGLLVDDSTICCHLFNVPRYLKQGKIMDAAVSALEGETLQSYIIDPKNYILHVCKGKPCSNSYIAYDVGKAFKKARSSDRIKNSERRTRLLSSRFLMNWLYKFVNGIEKLIPI